MSVLSLFRRKRKPQQAKAVALSRVRAKYDAAEWSDEHRRHWAHADNLSADAANSPEVRRRLRTRARYEIANDSDLNGMIHTLAEAVVGTGPRLQLLTEDRNVNQVVESEFAAWAHEINLAQNLRTLRMARAGDGEGFAQIVSNSAIVHPVKLDLRLIECDRCASSLVDMLQLDNVDGIEFDNEGNPVGYWILRTHPGDLAFTLPHDADLVPASSIIHYYRMDRPEQHRGVPELTPALVLGAQLRRYVLATLGAAETAADFAMFLKTMAAPEAMESGEELPKIAIEQRMLTPLPEGWEPFQAKAEQPTTTFPEFAKTINRMRARCLKMPLNVALGDSSGYNYASGRLDHQMWFKSIRIDRADIERVVLDRLFAEWLRIASAIRNYLPGRLRSDDRLPPHKWFWDGFEHVDPLKTASATKIELESNATTLAEVYGSKGKDWESELRQRAREKELLEELGLSVAPQEVPTQDMAEEQEEEAEESE